MRFPGVADEAHRRGIAAHGAGESWHHPRSRWCKSVACAQLGAATADRCRGAGAGSTPRPVPVAGRQSGAARAATPHTARVIAPARHSDTLIVSGRETQHRRPRSWRACGRRELCQECVNDLWTYMNKVLETLRSNEAGGASFTAPGAAVAVACLHSRCHSPHRRGASCTHPSKHCRLHGEGASTQSERGQQLQHVLRYRLGRAGAARGTC